jgi:hypothetical protein
LTPWKNSDAPCWISPAALRSHWRFEADFCTSGAGHEVGITDCAIGQRPENLTKAQSFWLLGHLWHYGYTP